MQNVGSFWNNYRRAKLRDQHVYFSEWATIRAAVVWRKSNYSWLLQITKWHYARVKFFFLPELFSTSCTLRQGSRGRRGIARIALRVNPNLKIGWKDGRNAIEKIWRHKTTSNCTNYLRWTGLTSYHVS